MSMDKIFGVAGSALAAQLVRMNTTASNLANAGNTAPTEEEAFKAKRVVFRTLINDEEVGDQTRYAGSIEVVNVFDSEHLFHLCKLSPFQEKIAKACFNVELAIANSIRKEACYH